MIETEAATSAGGTRLSRRSFLASSLGALAFGCVTGSSEGAGILDTHTHFYDPTRPEGAPWPPATDTFLHRPVLPDEFRRLVEPLGVQGTVVVEASSRVEDNQWLLDLADQEPIIRGVVGHLKPGQPEFGDQLARFAAHPRFRGIRTGLWGVSIRAEDATFVRDLRLLGERNLALDVLIAHDQLELIAELAEKLPTTRIVIDHCANVRIGERSSTWARGIYTAAEKQNIYMKVSGLVTASGQTPAPSGTEFYRPVLDTIWDAFGADRVIYGSDWPVSARAASYETVLRIVYQYFKEKGAVALRKYFWANATRVYGLVPV